MQPEGCVRGRCTYKQFTEAMEGVYDEEATAEAALRGTKNGRAERTGKP